MLYPRLVFIARRMNCAMDQASGVADPVPSPKLSSGRETLFLIPNLLRNHHPVVGKRHHGIQTLSCRREVSPRHIIFPALTRQQGPQSPSAGAAIVITTVRPFTIGVMIVAIPAGATWSFHLY